MFGALKRTALTGVPFGLFMGLFFTLQSGSPFGFVHGLAAGLLFGLLSAAFLAWQSSRFTREALYLEGEQLLKQGLANHFNRWEGVGGWLYLTDKQLLFRSHRFNFQNHELAIPLGEMVEIQACSTAWVIPNGLRIITAQGAERFVVEGRRSWLESIRQAKVKAGIGTS
jgi:hypothetical protein